MGIMNEYPIMRHMPNLESVITYEGTHDIHLSSRLDITGENVQVSRRFRLSSSWTSSPRVGPWKKSCAESAHPKPICVA